MRMKDILQEKDREIAKLKGIADKLQKFNGELQSTVVTGSKHWTNTGPVGGHDVRYWETLKEKVQEAIKDLQGG